MIDWIRKALAQTTSWYSIVRPSGTAAEYGELRSLLQRYALLDDEELRKESERLIRAEVERTGIGCGFETPPAGQAIGDLVAAAQRELDRIDRMFVPSGSKVLGEAAEGDALVDMVTAMLGPVFVDALPGADAERRALARALVSDVVIDGKTADDAVRARLTRAPCTRGRLRRLRRKQP